ncbi:hypothetical protein [Pseudomonas syringae]|nr:hypothetical protein [Pseudomonas syringae]
MHRFQVQFWIDPSRGMSEHAGWIGSLRLRFTEHDLERVVFVGVDYQRLPTQMRASKVLVQPVSRGSMQYYILRHEDLQGRVIDGDVTFIPALADYYQVGRDLIPAGTRVILELDRCVKKLEADFFLTTCGAFFVSQAMKNLLDLHSHDLDLLPADTRYASGNATQHRYFLVHARHNTACFDYLNSEYSGKSMILDRLARGELSADYKVRGIKKLWITMNEGVAPDFFFVDNILWIDPLISETVVNAAKSLRLRLNVEKICQPQPT